VSPDDAMDEPDVVTELQITEVPFADWTVMPPAPGLCPACAVGHPPEMPHNQQSLHYQYWFRNQEARAGREERWPTWVDAMAHCPEPVRETWTTALRELGVDI